MTCSGGGNTKKHDAAGCPGVESTEALDWEEGEVGGDNGEGCDGVHMDVEQGVSFDEVRVRDGWAHLGRSPWRRIIVGLAA